MPVGGAEAAIPTHRSSLLAQEAGVAGLRGGCDAD